MDHEPRGGFVSTGSSECSDKNGTNSDTSLDEEFAALLEDELEEGE